MNFITQLFDFLKDRNLHLSLRVGSLVIVLIMAIGFNDWIGFTRNYQIDAKLNQLEKLKRLDANQLNNPVIQSKLKNLSNDISNSEPFIYKLVPRVLVNPDNDYSGVVIPISADWYDITAMSLSYIVIIFSFIVLISIVWSRKPWKEIVNAFIGVVAVVLVTFGAGKLYKYILLLIIPIFDDHIWINYTLNVMIQAGVIITLVVKARRKAKVNDSH